MSTCFDMIYEEGVFIHGVHHTMSEDDVKFVMQVPWVSIGSDGSALEFKVSRQASSAQLRHQPESARQVYAR